MKRSGSMRTFDGADENAGPREDSCYLSPDLSRIKSIVVCVDFSASSRRALRSALRWCDQLDGSLTVLHVLDLKRYQHMEELTRFLEHEIRSIIGQESLSFVAELHHNPPGGIQIKMLRSEERAGSEILRFLRAHSPDLVILGQSSKTRLDRYFLGSTSSAVSARAQCLVLIHP